MAGKSNPVVEIPIVFTPDSALSKTENLDSDLLIVGIGASAGGLEALEQFFKNIPNKCGAAFVVIQHLDPTHTCLLPELLQRVTSMLVHVAEQGGKILSNCVYVIPPNKDLSILHGKLYLMDLIEPRGLHLPIDSFFKALAKDQGQYAVGVILSGMGSDGTLGLAAIKKNSGLIAIQTPASAKFDSMPKSAIDAGLADIIAPPEELPQKIFAHFMQSPPNLPIDSDKDMVLSSQQDLELIIILLREHTGNDFSVYKKNTIYRRIERRMCLHQINSISMYVRYLRENPQEVSLLFKELLIGVTQFFRDPSVWESLKQDALPNLFAIYPVGKSMRAWVPACSTGEEAYSLAILFNEALQECNPKGRFTLQIFATDLNADAVTKARCGFYPLNIAADIAPVRLQRYFVAEENGYRVCKEIREMVIFAEQNIIMDPPFIKLDFLCCRNLLIYFGQELQKKLIPLFFYALCPQGILLLGNAETIGNFGILFSVIDSHARLYRRIDYSPSFVNIEFPTKLFPVASMLSSDIQKIKPVLNLQSLVDQLLLQNYAPAAVVVNAEGDVLYINGRTGKYLEPAAGKANWNIHAMARDGLRHELASALTKVQHQSEAVRISGLKVGSNGSTQIFNLIVQAINPPEELSRLYIAIFIDTAEIASAKSPRKTSNSVVESLQTELQHAREELQILREEMQSSQEELKSSNEELQSTNEELQSTNEELTTSKEEMQSMNEELQTINAELQSKVTDLSWVNNDMKNLLNSMEIATIFLDNALNIRRFTSFATHFFKLISADIGRPLSDIASDLDYPDLHQDAQNVLQTLIFSEKQIQTCQGEWFKARIMPYRTQDNVIDGVVITFIDISTSKKLEAELQEMRL